MFREDQSFKGETVKNHFSRLATFFAWVGVFLASGAAANNHLFVLGQPCTCCTVEISDHSGVIQQVTTRCTAFKTQSHPMVRLPFWSSPTRIWPNYKIA